MNSSQQWEVCRSHALTRTKQTEMGNNNERKLNHMGTEKDELKVFKAASTETPENNQKMKMPNIKLLELGRKKSGG